MVAAGHPLGRAGSLDRGRWAASRRSWLLAIWALNQPITSVSVAGRFERVAPLDVERAVKESVAGKGLVSVNLGDVRAAVQDAALGGHRRASSATGRVD